MCLRARCLVSVAWCSLFAGVCYYLLAVVCRMLLVVGLLLRVSWRMVFVCAGSSWCVFVVCRTLVLFVVGCLAVLFI